MSLEMSSTASSGMASGPVVATSVTTGAHSTASTAKSAFRFGALEKTYSMCDKVTTETGMYMIHWGRSSGYGYLPESDDPKQIMKTGALSFWAVVTPLKAGELTTTNLTMECRACHGRSYFYYGTGRGPTCDPSKWDDLCVEEPRTTGGVVSTFEGDTGNRMKSLMSGFIKRDEPVGSESVPDYWKEDKVQEVLVHAVNDAIKEFCP